MSGILSSLGVHWMSLLAQLVNFSILAFVIYRFVIKPALVSLDARVKRQEEVDLGATNIEARLKEIEDSKDAILKEARTEGKKMISETEKIAKNLEEKLKTDAALTASKILSDAKAQIAAEREEFYRNLKSEVATLVSLSLEKTVGKYIDADANKKLAEEATKHLSQ